MILSLDIQMLLELYQWLLFLSLICRPPLRRCWAALYRLAAQHTSLQAIVGRSGPDIRLLVGETVSSRAGRLHSAVYCAEAAALLTNSAVCSSVSRAARGMASPGKCAIPSVRRLGRACRAARTVASVPRRPDGGLTSFSRPAFQPALRSNRRGLQSDVGQAGQGPSRPVLSR